MLQRERVSLDNLVYRRNALRLFSKLNQLRKLILRFTPSQYSSRKFLRLRLCVIRLHMIEACFKSVARALRQAFRREGDELPTTKGRL